MESGQGLIWTLSNPSLSIVILIIHRLTSYIQYQEQRRFVMGFVADEMRGERLHLTNFSSWYHLLILILSRPTLVDGAGAQSTTFLVSDRLGRAYVDPVFRCSVLCEGIIRLTLRPYHSTRPRLLPFTGPFPTRQGRHRSLLNPGHDPVARPEH